MRLIFKRIFILFYITPYQTIIRVVAFSIKCFRQGLLKGMQKLVVSGNPLFDVFTFLREASVRGRAICTVYIRELAHAQEAGCITTDERLAESSSECILLIQSVSKVCMLGECMTH